MRAQTSSEWSENDSPARVERAVGRAPLRERIPRRSATRRAATPVDVIDRLADDYERAMYCRAQAENYRRRWFEGRANEIAYVQERKDAGDHRFRRLTPGQVNLIGRLRWSESGLGRALAGREERYTRWMRMYLAFAEYQVPIKHLVLSGGERRRAAGPG